MAKENTVALIILLFGALSLSNARSFAEEPLPFPREGESSTTIEWKRSAAESALRIGLSGIAASLYQQLLGNVNEANEDRREFALGLATAQLAEGRFGEAEAILQNLDVDASPRVRLRLALLAHHRKDASTVSHQLKGISVEHLPPEERGWYHLLKGISMLGGKDRAMAQNFFDEATRLAVNEAQRTEFLVLLFRAKIEGGNADEILRVKLKNEWARFKNESAGFNFAIEYASVLQALDRPKEAIAVIEAQLKASGQHSEKKPDLLLALGLLVQDSNSKRGGEALEELVEQADDLVLAKAGLRILASRFDPVKDHNGAYIAFIDRLLASTDPHPLRENLLLVRAHAALVIGSDKKAEECCLRLMQEFPASPWKLDALKALAATAWRTTPPRYRLAANYLNDIRAAQEELGLYVTATALLLADCDFLNKDYENASSAYQNLLSPNISLEIRSKALFQYVQSLIELGHLEQAAEHLDENDFDSRKLPSWWRAEWNLVAALKKHKGTAKAFDRVRFTLKTGNDKLPEAAKIRLMWLQAQLSLDLKEVQSTPEFVDKVMLMLEDSTTLDKNQFDAIKAQAMLTKGQALLQLKKVDESFAVFETIRSQYPQSKQAALSYLLEANHHSVHNHLAEAQRNLVTLAEKFPKSEYAPRALYEASINAERRLLPESLQEAVRLLEVLATRFPASDLLFYARLRQGHILRNLNDFGAALEVYEEILRNEIFGKHPDRALASLSRADCLFAIARTDSAKILETAERYGDLFNLESLSVELRVEAGCKRALCLRKISKISSAKTACWEIIQRFVEPKDSVLKLGGKGRYWASRTILELGDMLERESTSKQAHEVYALIRKHGLPGEALATARTGNGKD